MAASRWRLATVARVAGRGADPVLHAVGADVLLVAWGDILHVLQDGSVVARHLLGAPAAGLAGHIEAENILCMAVLMLDGRLCMLGHQLAPTAGRK